MRIGLQEPDWDYIGSVLARTDDIGQIKFFKAFVKECETWGTEYQIGSQLAGVNHNLTDEEKEILGMIGYKE
jgi:hypothetical protein